MYTDKRNIKSLSLTLLSIVSALLGLYRTKLLTSYFGANEITDSFIIAWSIPIFVINFITGTLYLGLIPDLNYQFKNSYDNGIKLFWSINNATALIALIFIIPLLIIPKYILRLFFNFSSGEQVSLVQTQLYILLPTIFIMLINSNFNSYFSIKDKYIMPYLLQNIPLVLSIIGLFFHNKLGILGLSFGISLGNLIAIAILVMMFSIENSGIKYYPRLSLNTIKYFITPLVPLVIYQVCLQLITIIDNITATHLISGNLSILFYAVRLTEIIFQGAILTFIITIYPIISNKLTDNHTLINIISTVIKKIIVISIVIFTLILLIGNDVIRILFGSRKFSADEVFKTWLTFMIFSSGLLVLGWSALNQRLLILYRNYKFLAISGIIQVILKYWLNIKLTCLLGIYGIAVSTLIINISWLMISQLVLERYHQLKYIQKVVKANYEILIVGGIIIGVSILIKNIFLQDLNTYIRVIVNSLSVTLLYIIYFIGLKRYDIRNLLKS